MPAQHSSDAICLRCKATFASRRGLCRNCYKHYSQKVRLSQATWDGLERRGLARPALPQGSGWRKFPMGRKGGQQNAGSRFPNPSGEP
jgi:ribosomal protein L40E